MSEELQRLESMVSALLATGLPTPELIREEIDRVRLACPSVTDEQAEALARHFEHIHGVTMSLGSALEDADFEKWLPGAKSEIEFYFWGRYRRLLAERGFSGNVLNTLDKDTDRTLGLLENPMKEGKWDRRGMVVGYVQSGKTANYIGLISKAADAGYEVIIIIAGLHNNLRRQTQIRVDEGFTGFDSSRLQAGVPGARSVIGVGRYDSSRRPNAFTNTLRDFNKQTATSIGIPLENLKQPAVFVIKKNPSTLRNLLDWLKEHNAKRGASSIRAPMLLIDDEADNASINIANRNRDEVSRINGQIRQLLEIFDRRCYVAYTATPFANIFIDPDSDDEMFGADLFPRNFIISLDPPNNYFGPSRVFLSGSDDDGGDSIVRYIEDNGDLLPSKHKIDHEVTALPQSLKTAVRTFVVARAIRLLRGHGSAHNSMLVNASRFTNVQHQLRNEVHNFINTIGQHIRVNAAKPAGEALRDREVAELERVFRDEYADSGVCWEDVQHCLWDSISAIEVVEVNSRSSDSLDYDAQQSIGFNVIAVGGFSLSRGLTLEGLLVSYFLRNSMMYDTLMQMGRWFGYRPDYDDLCRIWMPEEADGWYAHIAESIEELREELRRMEAANATPQEFGLKVRAHPDTLIVTARNKMGSGQRFRVSIGLANRFVETAILRRDEQSMADNRRAAKRLADSLRKDGYRPESGEGINGGKLVKAVDVSHVIDFLSAFRNHEGSILTDSDPIRSYIEARAENELSRWDILFPGLTTSSEGSLTDSSLGFEVVCQRRKRGDRSDDGTLYISNKQRVSGRGIEAIGVSGVDVEAAQERYREKNNLSASEKIVNYPDHIYRDVRKRPLLVVHLIAVTDGNLLIQSEPVVAWSISFPRTAYEEKKVEYVVNTTWFRERYQVEEDEQEAGGDDD